MILDLDVKGGINVKRIYGKKPLSIFIKPPSIETLRQRLLSRATDSMEDINNRIDKAAYEMTFIDQFDCSVVNDVLANAVKEVEDIISEFVNKK